MSYPISVMKLAAEVPKLHYNEAESWQALYQMQANPEDMKQRLIYKAADKIAHQFVAHVMKKMQIQTFDDPDGRVTRFVCVAMSHQELVELLYRAYAEGQSDGIKRRPVFMPSSDQAT